MSDERKSIGFQLSNQEQTEMRSFINFSISSCQWGMFHKHLFNEFTRC